MSDDADEIWLDIGDPRVPEVVREHGLRFRNPCRYVVDLGNGEYALCAEDGEILDFGFLE